MSAVAKHVQVQPPAVVDQLSAIFAVVERIMMDKDIPVERAHQALDFYQKVEAERARKAFLEAKAEFKANAPDVFRDKTNTQYKSTYASIGNVVNTVNEFLAKYGLDASWDYDQSSGIKVTCILRHVLGHSERVSLTAAPDNSGSKNPLQQIKSTITYLRLATFEAVTGIATKEGAADDDGNGFSSSGETISEEQEAKLRDKLEAVEADLPRFAAYFKIEKISDLPAAKFDAAMKALDRTASK